MVLLNSEACYRALECLHIFSWRVPTPSLKNASSSPPTSLLSSDTLKELLFVCTTFAFMDVVLLGFFYMDEFIKRKLSKLNNNYNYRENYINVYIDF